MPAAGSSGGDFEAQTLDGWRDDVLAMIDEVAEGPVVLVGSSMGGWLMLLAALARPDGSPAWSASPRRPISPAGASPRRRS